MFKKFSLAAAVAAAMMLAACGGGGGNDGVDTGTGGNGNGNGGGTPEPTAGLLDPVQSAVSTQVLTPLATAAAGTPLQGVLLCTDKTVNQDTLDIVDDLLIAIDAGIKNPNVNELPLGDVNKSVERLVGNLSGLIYALAGNLTGQPVTCGQPVAVPGSNPLAGTALEPLGVVLLPALAAAQQALSGNGDLSTDALADLVSDLANAYAEGYALLPNEVKGAPILGGVLITLDHALTNLDNFVALTADGVNDGNQASSYDEALTVLVEDALDDLLTLVVPIGDLQELLNLNNSQGVIAEVEAAVSELVGMLVGGDITGGPINLFQIVDLGALQTLLTQIGIELPKLINGGSGTTSLLGTINGVVTTLLATLTGTTGSAGGGCRLAVLGLCRATP